MWTNRGQSKSRARTKGSTSLVLPGWSSSASRNSEPRWPYQRVLASRNATSARRSRWPPAAASQSDAAKCFCCCTQKPRRSLSAARFMVIEPCGSSPGYWGPVQRSRGRRTCRRDARPNPSRIEPPVNRIPAKTPISICKEGTGMPHPPNILSEERLATERASALVKK